MDARRMDVERGRALHREKRTRKLAVVVAVQNVLVVACLLVTVCGYWRTSKQEKVSDKNIHIEFGPISETYPNHTLRFHHVESSYLMSSVGDMIHINCTGPYFFQMDVCYENREAANGTLQLEVVGRRTPATRFNLSDSGEHCRGLDWTVNLRAEEQASMHLYAPNTRSYFRIKNATLSLTYLLGRHCQK